MTSITGDTAQQIKKSSVQRSAILESTLRPEVLIRIILLLTLVAYLPSLLFGFVYDDTYLVVLNPWMDSWKHVPAIFTSSFWNFMDAKRTTDYYRPLVMLVLLAIRQIAGAAPAWFHLVAVSIHLVATYLTFGLVRRLTAQPLLAAVAAGIFGLHPTKVESVAWISGISDSMCVVFFLGSVLAYLRWKDSDFGKKWLILSLLLLGLGILSKEAVILAPLVLAVYEFSTASDDNFLRRIWRTAIRVAPFVTVTALVLVARFFALRQFTGPSGSYDATPRATFFSAPAALLWYMRQQLWPAQVSIQYPILIVREFSWTRFVLPLVALCLLFGLIAWGVRRSIAGWFLLAWYLFTLAPVIVFHVALQVHDRYSYLPSVASSVGLAFLLLTLLGKVPAIRTATVIVLLLALTGFTIFQASFWDSDVKLFERAVAVAHDNEDAYAALTSAYGELGQEEKAIEVANRWAEQVPRSARPQNVLGFLWLHQKDSARARAAFEKASALPAGKYNNAARSVGLGDVEMFEGDCVQAEKYYRAALSTLPKIASFHAKLASALGCQGRISEASIERQLSWRIRQDDLQ